MVIQWDLMGFNGIYGPVEIVDLPSYIAWWFSIVMLYIYIYLVGGIPTPLKNMVVRQLGFSEIPNCFWKVMYNSMVPNHQPVCYPMGLSPILIPIIPNISKAPSSVCLKPASSFFAPGSRWLTLKWRKYESFATTFCSIGIGLNR